MCVALDAHQARPGEVGLDALPLVREGEVEGRAPPIEAVGVVQHGIGVHHVDLAFADHLDVRLELTLHVVDLRYALLCAPILAARSAERRVGKECVSTCRSRWSPYHYKKQNSNE